MVSLTTMCLMLFAMNPKVDAKSEYPKLFFLDTTDYRFVLSEKEECLLRENIVSLIHNLEKDLIPYKEWFVEEDQSSWSFISRKLYKPENDNTLITMHEYVCVSDIQDSKYTANLLFNKEDDPLLLQNQKYLFSEIKVGVVITVDKNDTKKIQQKMYFGHFIVVQ